MKRTKKLLPVFWMVLLLTILSCMQIGAAELPADEVLLEKVEEVTAAEREATEIRLTWKKVTGAAGYVIRQVNKNGAVKEEIDTTNKTKYTVEDLVPNQTYYFTVTAIDENGKEGLVSEILKTSTYAKVPAKPKKLRVDSYGEKSVTLKWNKVSGADGYIVKVYNSSKEQYVTKAKVKDKTTATISKLKAGQKYKFVVSAYRMVDSYTIESKNSSAVTATALTRKKLAQTVHARYYNTTVKATTRVTVVETGKKATIKAGTKVVVSSRSATVVTGTTPNGTKIKIERSKLSYTSLNVTTKGYSQKVKEAFVNYKKYSSKTDYLIWISQYTLEVSVFKGSRGKWELVRSMPCVIGTLYNSTPQGVYKIYARDYAYGGPRLYFCSANAFHMRVNSTSRGAASHGCIRLGADDLYFIANNCPIGTTVVSR